MLIDLCISQQFSYFKLQDIKIEMDGCKSNDYILNDGTSSKKDCEKFDMEQDVESDVQCISCGAVLSEEFAIWFRHRCYCCKECLPEETSSGYRFVIFQDLFIYFSRIQFCHSYYKN